MFVVAFERAGQHSFHVSSQMLRERTSLTHSSGSPSLLSLPGMGSHLGKTIGAMVLLGGDVYKLEVEEEDCCNPTVDDCVQLDVGVAEHAMDILGIHFYDEVSNSYNVHAKSL